MMLDQLLGSGRRAAYEHFERFVNDGSPSGFGPDAMSDDFLPSSPRRRFHLPAVDLPADEYFEFGEPGLWSATIGADLRQAFPVHPDMEDTFSARFPLASPTAEAGWQVWPTASARTVALDTSPVHLKLHYAGTLGRIDRSLPLAKSCAGVEVSGVLSRVAARSGWPTWLHFCPEPACAVAVAEEREWGVVVRDARLIESLDDFVVPLFSVFGHSADAPDGPSLATEAIQRYGAEAVERLRLLCLRIQESYFVLCIEAGLSAELNAQNVLVGLDDRGIPTGQLLLRDLMGFEKDLALDPSLGAATPVSFAYKRIQRSPDQLYWQQRHSLAYDHKVMYYCIDPVVEIIETASGDTSLRRLLRDDGQTWAERLPPDYFPPGEHGYRNQAGMLTGSRDYIPDVELLGRHPRV